MMSKKTSKKQETDFPVNEDGEPRENDKLAGNAGNNGDADVESAVNGTEKMDNKDTSDKQRHSRFEFLESRFQSAKTQLVANRLHRVIALLGLIIFILTIVLLVVTIKLATTTTPIQPHVCHTSECLLAASTVAAGMNSSFDPCDDFWSYSCSGWINKNDIPDRKGSWSVRDQIKEKINHELRHYIDLIPHDVDFASPRSKVRSFFQSCLNIDDIEYSSESNLKYDIQELGGWSLLNSWSFQNYDRNKVIERLHSKFGVTPFFRISVGPDDLDPNQGYIIKIEPAGLGLPGKAYYFDQKYDKQVSAYKTFMKEVAKTFGAQVLQANQFAENTFSYEKRLAEVTPDLEEYQDPLTYYNNKRYSIKDLAILAPSIKWLSLLQAEFTYSRINEGTRVLIAFEKYFKDISHILSTTDNGAINDYLMWRFASTYAPFLSKSIRSIHNEYNQVLSGVSRSELFAQERWEFCLSATSRVLGHALGSLFVENKLKERVEHANQAQLVVKSVKESILNGIDSFIWVRNEEARQLIKQKITNMEELIGYPNFILKEDQLKDYYKELVVENRFYFNMIHGVAFFNKKNEMLLKHRDQQALIDRSWNLMAQDVDIKYQYAGNILIIPSGILQSPLFDITLPSAMQFGSFGFQVTSEMLKAFDVIGIQYGMPDFRLSRTHSWMPQEAQTTLDEQLQCLYDELQGMSMKTQTLNPNLTISQTYIDIGALKFAFNSYKQWVSNRGHSGLLSGINTNNDQLFFISFAQSMCEAVRPQKSFVLTETQTQLSSQDRVNTLLRQSQHFANAFGCPPSSAMKNDKMCHLWH